MFLGSGLHKVYRCRVRGSGFEEVLLEGPGDLVS